MTDRDSKTMQLGLWRVPKPTDPRPSPAGGKSSAAAAAKSHPDYAVVFHRKLSPHNYAGYEAAGIATLLPLGNQLANGGRVAERAVLERMVEALKPMLMEPDNAPPPSQVGGWAAVGGQSVVTQADGEGCLLGGFAGWICLESRRIA